MNYNQRLKPFVLRLALAALGVSLAFFAAGSLYARALLPLCSAVLAAVQPQYEIQSLRLTGSAIHLVTVVHRQVAKERGAPLRMKRMVPVSLYASSIYVQPIVLLSLLAAWPLAWRKKMKALLLAVPVLVAISLVDIPFVLAWEVEDAIAADLPGSIKTLSFAGMEIQTRVQESQALTYWNVFLQTGGRQFLAILGLLLCIGPFYLADEPRQNH